MDVVYERCCGLDVHHKTVVAAAITPAGRQTRTFGTMTRDLLHLGDWLVEQGITHVAMESTGVYWKPIHNLLEAAGFTMLVVNAQHIKAVPGRKTDVKDAAWIADLLRHGLLRGSHIPDRARRELRELVRYRKTLVEDRANEVNRIHKVLEGANIKLGAVATDILGVSGRAMLTALVEGTTDPAALAALAKGRLRTKQPALQQALCGSMGPHQQLVLRSQLQHIDFLDRQIDQLSAEIAQRLAPHTEALTRLDTIPGVGRRTAEVLVAEIGTDMQRFPTAGHCAAWAGMCPGQNESGGKRRSGRTRKGSPWLRSVLIEAARAAARSQGTYLAAQYHRLAARRGAKRAAVAVGHTILKIAYHLLRDGGVYVDLGATYFDARDKTRTVRRAVRRLQNLGYTVTLAPTLPVPPGATPQLQLARSP